MVVMVFNFISHKSSNTGDVSLNNIITMTQANAETSEEFTDATDCVAVWEDVSCNGYSYSEYK
jgi:hypothetical protein